MTENEPNFDAFPKPSRQRAAEMFAAGTPLKDLATEFEVGERQMRRWLKTPEAIAVIAEVRASMVSNVTGCMIDRLHVAMERLRTLLDSSDERVVLGAIRTAFDATMKLRAFEEFDQRLSSVERRCGMGGESSSSAEESLT